MCRKELIIGILRRILGGANKEHVLAKVGNARQCITELTDVHVHGGRGLVGFWIGNQEDVHGEVLFFSAANHDMFVLPLVDGGDFDVTCGCGF